MLLTGLAYRLQVDVTPPGTKLEAFVNYTCGGQAIQLFVPLTYAYTEPLTNFDFHVAMQAVRLYPDKGTTIGVNAYALRAIQARFS